MNTSNHIPFQPIRTHAKNDIIKESKSYYQHMQTRRSLRHFSNEDIPEEVIKNSILAAGTAPNGANLQPWSFVVVKSAEVKKQIRESAEKVEKEFYEEKISNEWRNDLEQFKVNHKKPFLEEAPYLIVIFSQKYGITQDGTKKAHYYPSQSVGLATGFLISALHNLGISTLTYTPSPMHFLHNILNRPENESPYMILATGYAKKHAKVPKITKKSFKEIATIM